MSGNVNKVFLMGNLTRDVELRASASGRQVGSFGLAVNERYKKGDQWEQRANFFDCTVWGNRAEALAKYVGKGDPLFIEGKLRLEQWQDKDGGNRSKVVVVVDDFQFVGGREGGGGNGGSGSAPSRAAKPKAEPEPWLGDDEIPF